MGSLPPSGAENSAACFGPVATGRRKEKGTRREEGASKW